MERETYRDRLLDVVRRRVLAFRHAETYRPLYSMTESIPVGIVNDILEQFILLKPEQLESEIVSYFHEDPATHGMNVYYTTRIKFGGQDIGSRQTFPAYMFGKDEQSFQHAAKLATRITIEEATKQLPERVYVSMRQAWELFQKQKEEKDGKDNSQVRSAGGPA
jgi:hypothetical protein